MINVEDVTKENINDYNPNLPEILDYTYRILIIVGSQFGKTNTLHSLLKHQNGDDFNVIDKIYLHVKDPNEAKYQYLIKKQDNIGLKEQYSNNKQDSYKNIEDYNPDRKRKVSMVFDDVTAGYG